MKKVLIKKYQLYDNKMSPITIQLEGQGFKAIFDSEEDAKNGLVGNIDERYRNGSYSILPYYVINYEN